jgi:hypothetical protein|tara:strand:+ start:694 stop:960 length:267 start_codon:yes stop_codon:yes gene_type:complete
MTDSSSDKLSNAEMMMAQDLMESKIAEAKAHAKMTHLLMFGNFRMELVPSKDMDIEAVFRNTLEFLHEKYGEGILKTDMPGPTGTMHG